MLAVRSSDYLMQEMRRHVEELKARMGGGKPLGYQTPADRLATHRCWIWRASLDGTAYARSLRTFWEVT